MAGNSSMALRPRVACILSVILLICGICTNSEVAFADESSDGNSNVSEEPRSTDEGVSVAGDGESALIPDAQFALDGFSRAQKGSNRDFDGEYLGYTYYQGTTDDYAVAVVTSDFVLVYIPRENSDICDITDPTTRDDLKRYFIALDESAINGGVVMSDEIPWYFTNDITYQVGDALYEFSYDAGGGSYYVCVIGVDGSDVVSGSTGTSTIDVRPTHVDFAHVVTPDAVDVILAPTGFAAIVEFFATMDYSPLWVTLRTTLVAIVIIFILGLAAAYFTMRIPKRAQDIFDAIFTIPMVLPPTVCGFLLLLALGSNSPIGQWFNSIGIRLVFSWPATVIAAVVVAFPLMYRNSRGAFENLDSNMMDAARTLGWPNRRIFFRLMIPLSWSSIAAATVLAFARALGEFGATLFLAGNYAGITRTIPIAIYFEWMAGNSDVAIFWAVVVIIFSFIVILFVNLWGRRTTRYRRRES